MKRSGPYRIKREGKIAGVCAGLAEYFTMETWLVRILTISAFLLLAPPFVLVAYVALWFILEEKHDHVDASGETTHKGFVGGKASAAPGQTHYAGKGFRNSGQHEHHKVEVKSKVWQSGVPPRQAFIDIKQQYETVETKLRKLESYVTSKEFQLNREFNRL